MGQVSTCHWCHVMEHESFEDTDVAKLLNDNFISIKVDREERPDIDNIYMSVCQLLTGQGGWPLTVIMTQAKMPFYAGTYFPKEDSYGNFGLKSILNSVIEAWKGNRKSITNTSNELFNNINKPHAFNSKGLERDLSKIAFTQFKAKYDLRWGGFGTTPKFPSPHNLFFLLSYWKSSNSVEALSIVTKTLESMYAGGIYDHVGYGFCRYSTDQKWLVPHFEKMLYDNALIAIAYLEAFQATHNKLFGEVSKEIFTYILRDMTSPDGSFYSAEDADSEGVEGKFYLWSKDEVLNILDTQQGEKFCTYFDITEAGNFEKRNILNLLKGPIPESDLIFVNTCKEKLFSFREKRIHPFKDDKILTSWNGLMIAALAIAGRVFADKNYTQAAEKAMSFIFENLIRTDGRLMASYREHKSNLLAYVDDYAFLIWGLLELYETTYNPIYLDKALHLNSDLLKYFWDDENDGLFLYGSDGEMLISRPKEIYDGAMPSGNSVAALNLIRLSRITGNQLLQTKAEKLLNSFSPEINYYPSGYAFSLLSILFLESKAKEVVITGGLNCIDTKKMLALLNEDFQPFLTSVVYSEENLNRLIPYIEAYTSIDGKATAYLCKNKICELPVTDIESFRKLLNK